MNINAIKSSLNILGGPAMPCHYQVIITPPPAMLGGSSIGQALQGNIPNVGALVSDVATAALSIAGAANVSILAESASLPGKQLATSNFRMYGTSVKMPYGAVYDDLSLSFICTNSMAERLFFDTWMSFIMNPHRQYMHYYEDYVGTIAVIKLAPENDDYTTVASIAAANYIFLEAYPVTIQAQELSYGSTQEYLKLTVQFAYRRYTTLAEQIFISGKGATPKNANPFTTAENEISRQKGLGVYGDEITK